jgi:hypothetical protein
MVCQRHHSPRAAAQPSVAALMLEVLYAAAAAVFSAKILVLLSIIT